MIEIQIAVSGLALSVTEKPVITTGNRNTVKTVFDFEGDDLWDVCEKRALFWNFKTPKDIYPMPLDINNACTVPSIVLTNVGSFCFGVIGLAESGKVKKVSTIIKYQLKEGTPDGTTEVEEMPPDLWEQQLAIMGETLGAAQEAITTANAAVNIANNAVDTANDAVEKLDLAYVDDAGILHIFACENVAEFIPNGDNSIITNQNGGGNVKFWFGTQAEFDALENIEDDICYNIYNDEAEI